MMLKKHLLTPGYIIDNSCQIICTSFFCLFFFNHHYLSDICNAQVKDAKISIGGIWHFLNLQQDLKKKKKIQ